MEIEVHLLQIKVDLKLWPQTLLTFFLGNHWKLKEEEGKNLSTEEKKD